MDGSVLTVTSFRTQERASVEWPWPMNKMSFQWVCTWSLCACVQFSTISLEGFLPGSLKLLTPLQAANALVLHNAMRWFSAVGAGPAFLASLPLLRGHGRIRQALACVGLAAAVAKHCVISWFLGVTLLTAPNDDLLCLSIASAVIVVVVAVADVNASLVLLRRRPGGGEEE